MSKIGKKKIVIPKEVTISINKDNLDIELKINKILYPSV